MDLKFAKGKQFDAFKGNPLVKSNASRTKSSRIRLNESIDKSFDRYNFDQLWRGSVSNLMSSENITEDLIKESIKELENAMLESKRMLTERDEEITRLRDFIENNKTQNEHCEDDCSPRVLEQLENSQEKIVELEREISQMKLQHVKDIEILKSQKILPSAQRQQRNSGFPECTCYCGSVCKALSDLSETRQRLETTKVKYESLKQRVREFRKQAELSQRTVMQLNMEEDKSSSCVIQ